MKSIENKSKNETLIQARNLVYHWNERLIINLLQFLEGNDGPEAEEYWRLKGEVTALQEVATQKKCGFD